MIDTQLMHSALASIGIASAAAVLVSVLIIAIAAGLRGRSRRHVGTSVSSPAAASADRQPALR
jgi:hypothetical protein